jgi:hypothetical protein
MIIHRQIHRILPHRGAHFDWSGQTAFGRPFTRLKNVPAKPSGVS